MNAPHEADKRVRAWRIAADSGGTFTDCVAAPPDHPSTGSRDPLRFKILSTGVLRRRVNEVSDLRVRFDVPVPADSQGLVGAEACAPDGATAHVARADRDGLGVSLDREIALRAGDQIEFRFGEPAPVVAARLATGTPRCEPFPPMELRVATTRATNALLERRGARVAVFVSDGLGGLLDIGSQQRLGLFELAARSPAPLAEAVIECAERLDAEGGVLQAFSAPPGEWLQGVLGAGVEACAVAFAHADLEDTHERAMERALRDAGFARVIRASALSKRVGLLDRAQTAAAEAYLSTAMSDFVEAIDASLSQSDGTRVRLLTSAGGLKPAPGFRATEGLISGPAGGAVGALAVAQRLDAEQFITLDMGGTSTDVASFDRALEHDFTHTVGDVTLRAPAVAIETVAAGGGSICRWEHGRLLVGPQSAGAEPGPACYGMGGPLTLTDVNLLLGRCHADDFETPIDPSAARSAFVALAARVASSNEAPVDEHALLQGLIDIAEERMAGAIRAVCVKRARDPAGAALIAFGGAGPQHACGVAARLGVSRVIVPGDAGVLSAEGVLSASRVEIAERQLSWTIDPGASWDLDSVVADLTDEAARAAGDASHLGTPATRFRAEVRAAGHAGSLDVGLQPGASPVDALHACRAAFKAVYGYEADALDFELSTLRAFATWGEDAAERTVEPGEPIETITGPAVIREPHGAIVVPDGWSAARHAGGDTELERDDRREHPTSPERPVQVERELLAARLEGVASEMGELVRLTSVSPNVKDRLDFSCGVLSPEGLLLVSAPHIPVHLGALGLCVRKSVARLPIGPGDVLAVNHPAFGGSHLPDVTLIAGIHSDDGDLLGYVATRAHHAEIGGRNPGSIAPLAERLDEEGAIIEPTLVIERGRARWDPVERVLRAGPWPSRDPETNLMDLRAQCAACLRGAERIRTLAAAIGAERYLSLGEGLRATAADVTTRSLERWSGRRVASDRVMEGGERIRVAIDVGERTSIDFTGTSAAASGAAWAPEAVTRSAVLYALRLLADAPIPLNDGVWDAVDLRLGPCFLNPQPQGGIWPAVALGNTESSQQVVLAVLDAFGVSAESQGTMNNLAFGTERGGWYETIGGGAGATVDAPGASGVHSHMTNTRLSDIEILERSAPVRVELLRIRADSGGPGRRAGGDGVVRRLRATGPIHVSFAGESRSAAPRGREGGADGAPGEQVLIRADGSEEAISARSDSDLAAGDAIEIRTPGGGGWGAPGPA